MNFEFRGKLIPDDKTIRSGGALKILPEDSYIEFLYQSLREYRGQPVRVNVTDDIQKWTQRANRMFEGLVRKWFNSGDYDYWEAVKMCPRSFEELRLYAKVNFIGCEVKMLYDGAYLWVQSITEVGKKQFAEGIDNLLNHLTQKGINVDQEMTDWRS